VTRALLLTDRGARGRDLDAETRSIKLARVLGLTSPPSASCELFSVRLDGAGIRCAGAPRIGGVDHADWGATPASYAGVGDPEGDADRRDLVRALQGVALFPPPPPSRLVLLLARITHALPIAWRVTLHEAYESIFNASAASDIVWLGVDIDALATNVREWRFERKFGGRTLVVCDAPSTVPTGVALKRRCGDAVFLVSLRPQVGVADARFDLVGSGAFYTLVPIRPRRRCERRSLRTFPGASLRPPLAFNPRPRRLSTSTDAFQLHPLFYGEGRRRVRRRGAREGGGREEGGGGEGAAERARRSNVTINLES
jgi:hypothetical protein